MRFRTNFGGDVGCLAGLGVKLVMRQVRCNSHLSDKAVTILAVPDFYFYP